MFDGRSRDSAQVPLLLLARRPGALDPSRDRCFGPSTVESTSWSRFRRWSAMAFDEL
jgi:hypothetical protein